MKKVFTHFRGAQLDEHLIVKIFACVSFSGQIRLGEKLSGADIFCFGRKNLFSGECAVVDTGFSSDNLTGSQVTVLLGLNQGIFIHGFAKIGMIVGGNLFVFGRGFFRFLQLAGSGG